MWRLQVVQLQTNLEKAEEAGLRDADPAQQQKLKEWGFARNPCPQGAERLVRNKGPQSAQRHSAQRDGAESVSRIKARSGEVGSFHDRADF